MDKAELRKVYQRWKDEEAEAIELIEAVAAYLEPPKPRELKYPDYKEGDWFVDEMGGSTRPVQLVARTDVWGYFRHQGDKGGPSMGLGRVRKIPAPADPA